MPKASEAIAWIKNTSFLSLILLFHPVIGFINNMLFDNKPYLGFINDRGLGTGNESEVKGTNLLS